MTFYYGSADPLQNGEIFTRTLPTGASMSYEWGKYYYLSGDTREVFAKHLRMTPGGSITASWTYTREAVLTGTPYTNPKYVTVKDPVGNETVYHYRASLQNPT